MCYAQIGESEQIDYVPDFPISPKTFEGRRLVCRYDICNNKEALVHFLHVYGGTIYTSEPIDINLLLNFKPRIPQLIYLVSENYSKEFVKQLHGSGINYELVSHLRDQALSNLKLELFDYNQIKGFPEPEIGKITEDHYFESKRVYLSKGIFFASRYHYCENLPIQNCDFKVGAAIHSKNFLESFNNCYFYEKI